MEKRANKIRKRKGSLLVIDLSKKEIIKIIVS